MSAMHIITWDWKGQPDWDDINFALNSVQMPQIYQIETGSDQFGVVIAPDGLTTKHAQDYYDEHEFDGMD